MQENTELDRCNGEEESALTVLHLSGCLENCELGAWYLKEDKLELWQKEGKHSPWVIEYIFIRGLFTSRYKLHFYRSMRFSNELESNTQYNE